MVNVLLLVLGLFSGFITYKAWKNPDTHFTWRAKIWVRLLGQEGYRKLTKYVGVPLAAVFTILFLFAGIFS